MKHMHSRTEQWSITGVRGSIVGVGSIVIAALIIAVLAFATIAHAEDDDSEERESSEDREDDDHEDDFHWELDDDFEERSTPEPYVPPPLPLLPPIAINQTNLTGYNSSDYNYSINDTFDMPEFNVTEFLLSQNESINDLNDRQNDTIAKNATQSVIPPKKDDRSFIAKILSWLGIL
jgi:hypothetical protein